MTKIFLLQMSRSTFEFKCLYEITKERLGSRVRTTKETDNLNRRFDRLIGVILGTNDNREITIFCLEVIVASVAVAQLIELASLIIAWKSRGERGCIEPLRACGINLSSWSDLIRFHNFEIWVLASMIHQLSRGGVQYGARRGL